MSDQILDLDANESISTLVDLDVRNLTNTLYHLGNLIKMHGTYESTTYVHPYDASIKQFYRLSLRYLGFCLGTVFELSISQQLINRITLLLYNVDRTKIYLNLCISMADDPMLIYIENDQTGYIPTYTDANVKLSGGAYLMNMCHCFLTYIGFDRMRLDDDSYLVVKNNVGDSIKTKLWLYLILTKGRNWYAKFGYISINPDQPILIADVKNIRLDHIVDQLLQVMTLHQSGRLLDTSLITSTKDILSIIGEENISGLTLETYAQTRPFIRTALLLNNLGQSVFTKPLQSGTHNICFTWAEPYHKLAIANIVQTNNNISNYVYRLIQKN